MRSTDIAIIGLACRFPAAANPGDFWRLVHDGREASQSTIDGVADFDAKFFNLSPREASAMDPRQRLALELTWELLEDACVVPESVRGQQVAVYLGAMNDDYAFLTLRDAEGNVDHHSFAGTSRGMIANRVSYAFGMHGPSVTIDSGQSSSLVAVHLACESLRTGASPLAIAGGVHLNLANETAALETEFGALSATGHTYAFDARADGYVRSEGAGLVLLKPLRSAIEDGNPIRAVIRGSAVGNDGHSAAGMTVPSVSGQADVIRRALSGAGLDSAAVHYVEAHGTGTEIGDPVEATALGEVFAARQHRPLSVGSVKTNIGHTGGAAGIAGLLKTVLALENAVIPPSLNYTSAAIDLESLGLQVNTTLTPWPPGDRPRRAGVSAFGMGGTNAHVIVEQAPEPTESIVAQRDEVPVVVPWVVSARSAEALTGQAQRLLAWLIERPELSVVDVGYSLVSTRAVFEHRAVVVGGDREQLMAGLAGVVVGRAASVGKTVWVFPGQGAQWLGMGRGLYGRFAVFAKVFDEVCAVLDSHVRVPLRSVMWGSDAGLLESTEFAQPALFAVEVALAAVNGPEAVVVSGSEAAVGVVVDRLVGAGRRVHRLAVSHAFHSVLMEPMLGEFERVLAGVSVGAPRVGLVSNVSGGLAGAGYGSASYWVEHVRRAVRFADSVGLVESLGASVFVEVGPGGGLSAAVEACLSGEPAASVALLGRDRAEVDSLLGALGRLFVTGVAVQWDAVFADLHAHRVELPTYAFARQRFWLGDGEDAPDDHTETDTGATHRWQELAPAEQHRQLVELVCGRAANVLGHSASRDIDADRAFQDLGFDSVTGVELRDRLKIDTGLTLSRTLIFDYPTPTALADYLGQRLSGTYDQESDDEKIWSLLRKIPIQELRRTGLLDKLLLLAGTAGKSQLEPPVSDDVIDSLSPDDLIAMALNPADDDDIP